MAGALWRCHVPARPSPPPMPPRPPGHPRLRRACGRHGPDRDVRCEGVGGSAGVVGQSVHRKPHQTRHVSLVFHRKLRCQTEACETGRKMLSAGKLQGTGAASSGSCGLCGTLAVWLLGF